MVPSLESTPARLGSACLGTYPPMLGFYLMATRRVQQTLGHDWFHTVSPSRECAHYDCQACRRYFAELGRAEESLGYVPYRRSSGPVNTTPRENAEAPVDTRTRLVWPDGAGE